MHVTDGDHPYMKHWWVPGLQIGYEHTFIHQFADFCHAAADGRSAPPTFRDGLSTDYVTDAVLKSARSRPVGEGRRRRGATHERRLSEFLAFDLGAESGRAMRASLHTGTLALAEVHRFPNAPVRDNGSLRWDIHRVWREMQAALERSPSRSI